MYPDTFLDWQDQRVAIGRAIVRDGRIEQQVRPMDIYLNPVNIFVDTFIGAPAMNMDIHHYI